MKKMYTFFSRDVIGDNFSMRWIEKDIHVNDNDYNKYIEIAIFNILDGNKTYLFKTIYILKFRRNLSF